MDWKVIPTKRAAKDLENVPKKIGIIYRELVDDMEREGPFPFGWDSQPLKGSDEVRVKLTREWRVLVQVMKPSTIVVRIVHRKEAYR